MVKVKVSAKSARLPFHGCDPHYIATTCLGRCCEGSSGLMVSIHSTEVDGIRALGGVVKDGLLIPADQQAKGAAQRCQFKATNNLCSLHGSPHKPFGCIASPFTLNRNDTLIVRNRYKLLRCYNDGPRLPAYVAFRASLDLIFGHPEAARICDHLADGGNDIEGSITELNWHILHDNDATKPHAR